MFSSVVLARLDPLTPSHWGAQSPSGLGAQNELLTCLEGVSPWREDLGRRSGEEPGG